MIVEYTVVDEFGTPRRYGYCDDSMFLDQGGINETVVPGLPPSEGHVWNGAAWLPRPSQPSARHSWVNGEWVTDWTIERARDKKNSDINHWREEANETFEYGGKQFSSDSLSWKDIAGAHGWIVATGALPPGWPGAWKAVDNSFLPITNTTEWMAFYGAAVARGSANFMRSQALKAYMNDPARTIEEVDAITWEMEIPT